MKAFLLVAALAAFGVAQGALADNNPDLKPYSLRLELPSDSVDCGARATSLGSVFAAQTGLTVTNAVCQDTHSIVEGPKTYKTVTVVIDYMAAAEVAPNQAIFSGSDFLNVPSDHEGLFASYGDCLSARGAQEAAFAANTGLQVFASFCQLGDEDMTPSYSLIVEGFGTPKAELYAFSQDSTMGPVPPQVITAVTSAILQSGGSVVLSDDSHVFYYSTSGTIDVRVDDLGLFTDASQCQSQVAAAEAIYVNAKAVAPSAFCVLSGDSTNATLTAVAANALDVNSDYGSSSSTRYSSFADCMGDMNRVLQNAQSNGVGALGAICRPSDSGNGTFEIDLYSSME